MYLLTDNEQQRATAGRPGGRLGVRCARVRVETGVRRSSTVTRFSLATSFPSTETFEQAHRCSVCCTTPGVPVFPVITIYYYTVRYIIYLPIHLK